MKRHVLKTPYQYKGSYDLGLLYPIGWLEVMQGQTTYLNTSALIRAQPLVAPAYEKMECRIVHFYVPFRILWEDWDDFICGDRQITIPHALFGDNKNYAKTLLDYFGLPTDFLNYQSGFDVIQYRHSFNYWLFLAYYMIWNRYFKDENDELQPPVDIEAYRKMFDDSMVGVQPDGSGGTPIAQNAVCIKLKRVNWGKDRFIKALTLEEGQVDTSVPVRALDTLKVAGTGPTSQGVGYLTTDSAYYGPYNGAVLCRAPDASVRIDSQNGAGLKLVGGMEFSLNDLDLMASVHNFKINENKFGSDYKGYRKKYGLSQLDGRLGEPELIGGFGSTISISDVLGTGDNNLGKQGGHALGFAKGKKAFKHYAPEYGFIITMMYFRPKASYAEAVDRFLLKGDMLDFFQYEFKDVGYQPIYPSEVDMCSALGSAKIFGYEPRYNEYRSKLTHVVGELKPNNILSHWANPRVWSKNSGTALNSTFLECNPNNQIWASPNTDKFIAFINHNVTKKSFVGKAMQPKIDL